MSRMWMLSFSPGLTTIAFMRSSLEIRQRIGRRDRMALRPVVITMTFETAAFGLRAAFRGRMARGACRLGGHPHIGRLGAPLGGVTACALHHQVRSMIEARARHPL